MNQLLELFANNRRWASDLESRQPGFFAGLAAAEQLYTEATTCSAVVPGARGGVVA